MTEEGRSTVSPPYLGARCQCQPVPPLPPSYPCNIGGLRLDLSISAGSVWYAVMVVRQGNATPSLNISNAANPIASPEADVMLCGIASAANDIPLTCKTQRKMQQGDELVVLLATPNTSVSVSGTIQSFEIV